jgi:hypothetical protein
MPRYWWGDTVVHKGRNVVVTDVLAGNSKDVLYEIQYPLGYKELVHASEIKKIKK